MFEIEIFNIFNILLIYLFSKNSDKEHHYESHLKLKSSSNIVDQIERMESFRIPSSTKKPLKTFESPLSSSSLLQSDGPESASIINMIVPTVPVDEAFCDFGPLPVQSLCEWQDGCGALKWMTGTGLATNWLGGPPNDSTAGTVEGGYIMPFLFFNTYVF